MITLQLTPADVEKVRFAFSPLIELASSFKLLNNPENQSDYQAWVDETRRMFDRLEFPFMSATILPHRYIVDFLTPTPTKMILNFEEEIDRVRETPDEVIRKNIEFAISVAGMTPIRQMFLDDPREALECLIEELRFYWQQALEPHWSQLSSILEADVLFRARALALYGIDAMFTDLSERVEYNQGEIRIHKEHKPHYAATYQLKGEGVQLVPSVFAVCGGLWQVVPEYLPMLIYQTRGLGLWKGETHTEPVAALQLTLGTSRARLLQALTEPSHTNELAQRLSLTAGAISQQLGRLGQAGLIESYRSGAKVYYRLSTRGERLLDVFTD
jgi:DNA-binding transcriptional ArsR family regulator